MIRPLGDRLAVRRLPGVGKIGALWIPDVKGNARNQTFAAASVVGHGPEVEQATTGTTVLVSELFGEEAKVGEVTVFIGRERDIVGLLVGDDIQPVKNRVLLERVDRPGMAGALYLPDKTSPRHQTMTGRVVACAVGCDVRVGDTVLVPKQMLVTVHYGGRELFWVGEPEVLTVI